jgi:hypothetical protein
LLLFNPTSPTEGRGDAKPLKSLGRSFKRRHYRNEHSREVSAAPGSDFRRRLSRKLELQLSKQEQLILLWLRITGQDNHPIVRRGQFDIDHLHRGEFFEHGHRRQSRRQRLQPLFQRDQQAMARNAIKTWASIRLSSWW